MHRPSVFPFKNEILERSLRLPRQFRNRINRRSFIANMIANVIRKSLAYLTADSFTDFSRLPSRKTNFAMEVINVITSYICNNHAYLYATSARKQFTRPLFDPRSPRHRLRGTKIELRILDGE